MITNGGGFAATCVIAALLCGCAKPVDLTGLPWVSDPTGCEEITFSSHGGISKDDALIPSAHGIVALADGRPVDQNLYVRVHFSTLGLDYSGQTIAGDGPEFDTCIGPEDVRWARNQFWRAEVYDVRDGTLLYRTPKPQPFEPQKPIVIVVTPVE